jgi:lysophospholipase L1-like esterase
MGRPLLPPLAAFLSLVLFLASFSTEPSARAQGTAPAYLALGDSLAYGIGATDRATGGYVALVHEALEGSEQYGESGIEMLNLGVPGAKSADLLAEGGQLEQAVVEIRARAEDPDSNDVEVISVDIGGNDLLGLVTPGSPCLESASVEPCRAAFGEVLSAIDDNLSETLARLREEAPEAIIVVVDLYNPYSGTGDLREPIAEVGVGQANGVIGAVTADGDLAVATASIAQLFSGRGNQWIAPDGIHPNDSGHRVIAEAVAAAIDKREPVVPQDLLSLPPGATAPAVDPSMSVNGDADGGVSTLALVVSVVVAFVAGAAVSGAYFFARGRG